MDADESCRKVRHSTAQQAENALARTWRKGHVEGGGRKLPTRVYECPNCSGWHLTSGALLDRDEAAS